MIENGVTGMIIKAPTIEQIEAAVLDIYLQPDRGRAMGEKAHAMITAGHFSEADIQKQFMDVFLKAKTKADSK